FGFAGSRNFRNRVNAHGQHRGDALFVLEAEGVANGDATLLHRSRSERRKANHIARCVNAGNGSAIVFIDGDIAAVVEGKSRSLECEAVDGSATSGGEKSSIGTKSLAALHGKRRAGS